MTFQRERISDLWDEAFPLFAAHHNESGVLTPEDLAPSRSRYESLEAIHMSRLFTARHNGELVGYAIFHIMPHLQYSKKMFAMQDVVYMKPEHRGISGTKFLVYTDSELRAERVDVIVRHVASQCDYSRTLSRLGYSAIETAYMRVTQ